MRRTSFVSLILVLGLASLTLLLRANVLQVPAGTWAPGSVISNPRVSGSAVLLQNGRLLITGGDTGGGPSVAADLVAADGSASPIPSMSVPRSSHMSVALQDGRVLVAGGSTTGGGITNSAEIFDPIANTWTSIPGGMTEARAGAIAALLSDGRVLIAAGEGSSGTISSSIEIFDPVANAFSFAGTLSSPRKNHASAVLVDGRVLIVGGSDANDTLLATSDIFDPITNTVAAGPRLSAARKSASATTLLDGRVLVAGGTGVVTNPDNPTTSVDLGSAEILDAAATAFTPSPSAMITARTGHQALLLPHNSSVLFVGGNSNGVPTASGELFVPWAASQAGAFQSTAAMSTPRAGAVGSAFSNNQPTSQNDGLLFVAGGIDASSPAKTLASSELYGFAWVKTDAADYAPGTTVTITGSGWQPGETVTLTLVESPLIDTHPTMTAVADSNGNIVNAQFSPDSHDVNIRFYLIASGSVSQAQTTFTDANPNTLVITSQDTNLLTAGSLATYTVTETFNGNNSIQCKVDLTVAPTASPAWPSSGVSFSFAPSTLISNTGTTQTSTLTISTPSGMAANTYNFTVTATPETGSCQTQNNPKTLTINGTLVLIAPVATSLALAVPNPTSAAYSSSGPVTFSATLTRTSGGADVSGATVSFSVDGMPIGNAVTNGAGVAMFSTYNPSVLSTGAHNVQASFPLQTISNVTYALSNSGTQTLTVNKANTTTTVTTNPTANYGDANVTLSASGTANSPATATVNEGTVTFTVKQGAITIGTVTSGTVVSGGATATFSLSGVNAGSYSIQATYNPAASNPNFNTSTAASPGTLTINKATPTVTVAFSPSTLTYDGNGHAATSAVTGVNSTTLGTSDGTVTISYKKGGVAFPGTPTDAASYTASASFVSTKGNYNNASSTVDASLIINKATPIVAVTFGTSPITYDGNSHPASTTVTGVNNTALTGTDGTVTVTYTPGATYAPKNAGSYSASAHFASTNGNYTDADSTVNAALTINKADAQITVSNFTGTYDGNAHGVTGSATGVETVPANLTSLLNFGATFTNVPGGTAHWTFNAGNTNGNYNQASGDATVTINKATPTVTISFASSPVTYDGMTHAASTGVIGVNNTALTGTDGTVTITYTPGGTYAPKNAGNYSASAHFAPTNGNYTDADSTLAASLVINKATPIVVVTFGTSPITYDGNSHPASTTVTGVNNTPLTGADDSVAITYTPGGSYAPQNAGSYSASAHFASSNGNYTDADSATPASLVINKATPSVTVSFASSPITYDGNSHPATAMVTGVSNVDLTGHGTLSIIYTPGASYVPTNAGSYIASAHFASTDSNYIDADSNAPVSLTITKASSIIAVTFEAGPYTYRGSAFSATAAVTGVGGLNQAVPVSYTGDCLNVSTVNGCTGTASFPGDTNHYGSSDTKNITITQASSTTVVTFEPGPYTYRGAAFAATAAVSGVGGLNKTTLVVYSGDCTNVTSSNGCTATANFAGDTNHTASTDSESITITQASSSTVVTFESGPYTYRGTSFTAAAVVTGVGGLNQAVVVVYSGECTNASSPNGCTATGSYGGDANHTGSIDHKSITITQASSTTVLTFEAGPYSYRGTPFTASAIVSGVGGLGQAVLVVYSGECTSVTSANGCTATATFAGDTNHTGSYDTKSITITPAGSTTTVIFEMGPYTYRGTAFIASASVTGAGGLAQSAAIVYTGDCTNVTSASGCTATATYAGDTNHTGSADHKSITISQASSSTVVTFESGPYTYRGTSFTASAVVTGVGGLHHTVTVAYSGDCTNVTAANGCTATATFAGDTDHTGSTDTKAITILQAPTTTTVSGGGTFTYTGLSHPASVSVAGAGGLSLTPPPIYSGACTAAPVNVPDTPCTASYTYAGDSNHTGSSGSTSINITKINQTITWNAPVTMTFGAPLGITQLNATVIGVSGGTAPGALAYNPIAGTLLPAGPNSLTVTAAATANYNSATKTVTLLVQYQGTGTICAGDAGHQILQPINADGSSVFNGKSTSPAKFRVCDANGVSIGAPGVVASFGIYQIIAGTTTSVNEDVASTTPDSTFRWDPTGQQWIFNINNKSYAPNQTYYFQIMLNDGSSILFRYGLK